MKGSENELSQNFKKYQRPERNRGKDLLLHKIEGKDILKKKKDILLKKTIILTYLSFVLWFLFFFFSLTGISNLSTLSSCLFVGPHDNGGESPAFYPPYNAHETLCAPGLQSSRFGTKSERFLLAYARRAFKKQSGK